MLIRVGRLLLLIIVCMLPAEWLHSTRGPGQVVLAKSSSGAVTVSRPPIRKIALLVGINRYKYPGELSTLDGCLNDIESMNAALTSQPYGFKLDDIVILRNEQATRANIIKNFENHLIAKAEAGAIVVFHYAGHGSTMKNPSDPSGYDNTIVPYDSRDPQNSVTDIRDKELNALIRRLAKKTQNITCILDSCRSGTILRTAGKVRRAPEDTRFGNRPPAAETFGEAVKSRDAGMGSGYSDQDIDYALITGCRTDQLSFELKGKDSKERGALTYHLVQELLKPTSSKRTYRDVMDRVIPAVRGEFPNQTPQLEGKGVNRVVFGDETIQSMPYVIANPASGSKVEIEGGLLHGFTVGSVFDIYRPEAHSFQPPEAPVASVKLSEVGPLKSVGQLDGARQISSSSKAVERQHNFEAQKTRIYYENLASSPALRQIKAALDAHPSRPVQAFSEPRGFQIRLEQKAGYVRTFGPDGLELSTQIAENDPTLRIKMEKRILAWARWFSLMSIQNPGSSVQVEFTLIPKGNTNLPSPGQILAFTPGEKRFDVKIKNLSTNKLFVYILDLTSTGKVRQVYPDPGSHVPVNAMGEADITDWNVAIPGESPGYVRDVFKLIATTNQVDLSFLEQDTPRGQERWRGQVPNDPLNRLLFESALGQRDGSRSVAVDWVTVDRAFEVCKLLATDGSCKPR